MSVEPVRFATVRSIVIAVLASLATNEAPAARIDELTVIPAKTRVFCVRAPTVLLTKATAEAAWVPTMRTAVAPPAAPPIEIIDASTSRYLTPATAGSST